MSQRIFNNLGDVLKIYKVGAAVLTTVALSLGFVGPVNAASTILKLGVPVAPVSQAADQAQYGGYTWFYQSVYDTLLRKTESGALVPGLATKWTYNARQTSLTLVLRSGVKFTDGAPLNAAAVVANLNANKSKNGPMASYLTSMKSAVAASPASVVITLSDTDPAFLGYLADTAGLIASPKTIGKSTSRNKPIGSGPFVLDTTKTVAGSKFVYKANPNYWDKANRRMTGLQINVYENAAAMVNALRSGAIQGAGVGDAGAARSLVSAGFKTVKSQLDAKGIYFADRGGKRGSCIADINVRRAINTVFDRAAIVKSLAGGAGRATSQFIPSSMSGFDRTLDSIYTFSETKALSLMAQSSFPNGCSITMPTAPGYFGEATYSVINSQLAKIKITVKEEPAGQNFFGDLLANKYDAFYMQFERSSEPWALLNYMVAPTAAFPGDGFGTPQVTKLLGDYKRATAAKRPAILKQINGILVRDAWFGVWYAAEADFIFKGFTVKSAQAGNGLPFLYNITK